MLVRPLRRMLVSSSSTSSASEVWLVLASGVHLAGITRMHRMQVRASARGPVMANAAQAVGFMCCNCDGVFDSRRSMEYRHRHITSLGTPCADPSSCKSFSFTGRADMSTGTVTLCQHEGTLVALSILCSMLLPQVRTPRSLTIIFGV